jgi:Sigma-70 region 2
MVGVAVNLLGTARQPIGAPGASNQYYDRLLPAPVMTAARGDEFAEYAAASIPSLRRLALLLCRNWHDADDLVQATLAKLCQHWYRAAAADSTDAYVRAILVREFVRGRRTGWARRVSVTDQPPEIRAPAADLDMLLDLRRRLRGDRLHHRRPRDPQTNRDLRLRHTLRRKPADQGPVLQSDHSPIVESVHFPSVATVQFSSGVDTSSQNLHKKRQKPQSYMPPPA